MTDERDGWGDFVIEVLDRKENRIEFDLKVLKGRIHRCVGFAPNIPVFRVGAECHFI